MILFFVCLLKKDDTNKLHFDQCFGSLGAIIGVLIFLRQRSPLASVGVIEADPLQPLKDNIANGLHFY